MIAAGLSGRQAAARAAACRPAGHRQGDARLSPGHHLLRHPTPATAPAELAAPDPASSLSRQIAIGAHPSVLHLTRPPSTKKPNPSRSVVTVDEIRKVNRFLSMTSHDGSYRVVIVDPADDMNTNAANALLKNLEEPPSRTLFILIAHSIGRPAADDPLALPDFPARAAERGGTCDCAGSASDRRPAGKPGGQGRRSPSGPAAALRKASCSRNMAVSKSPRRSTCWRAAKSIDIAAAHRLADAVAARGQTIQFDIFNRAALDLCRPRPQASCARRGCGTRQPAVRISGTNRALKTIEDAETYNLDRSSMCSNVIVTL